MADLFGLKKVLSNFKNVQQSTVDRVAKATEQTAVLVANHAKANHDKGFAHAISRYENQTTNLTNSIMPELTKADKHSVEAMVHTNKEYAIKVEMGSSKTKPYPFMLPALISQRDEFQKRVGKAIHV